MEPKRFEEIKREFYNLLPDDRTEDMADLIAEVECLQTHAELTMKEPICAVCFTRSWQPCPPNTPDCVEDNTGGWMVCGYCRLVVEYKQVSNKLTICEDFITRLRKEKSK